MKICKTEYIDYDNIVFLREVSGDIKADEPSVAAAKMRKQEEAIIEINLVYIDILLMYIDAEIWCLERDYIEEKQESRSYLNDIDILFVYKLGIRKEWLQLMRKRAQQELNK